MTADPQSMWGRYFDDVSRKKGDTEAANSYFSVKNFRFFRGEVLRLLGAVSGKRILDVGCGTGHFSQALAGDNFVVGIDISSEMLMFVRSKGLTSVRASGLNLPFISGGFDIVFANNVIQHIPDGSLFIGELARVVRPGGRIIIGTINAGNAAMTALRFLERKKYKHLQLYPVEELGALITAAGGRVENTLYLCFPFGRTKTVRGGEEPGAVSRRIATSVVVDAVIKGVKL